MSYEAAFKKADELVKNLPKEGPNQSTNDEKLQVSWAIPGIYRAGSGVWCENIHEEGWMRRMGMKWLEEWAPELGRAAWSARRR
jgi:hypothetical protein